MTVADAATVAAPAKLTRSLRITGVRDDGYHLLDAEMVTLDLHDVLTFRTAGSGIEVHGPYATGVPTDDTNIVARALALAGTAARVTIDKRIPHGGGLGGGSADAAAALRWAGFGSDPDSLVRAATVGADVPFCLVGGRARVRGIGEVVAPLPHETLTFTLVVPPLVVSTPEVYRTWDGLGGPTADGPNDLEPAAIVSVPELGRWRDRIGELVGRPPVLAGSGATWFVEGEHHDALTELVDEGAKVLLTQATPASG